MHVKSYFSWSCFNIIRQHYWHIYRWCLLNFKVQSNFTEHILTSKLPVCILLTSKLLSQPIFFMLRKIVLWASDACACEHIWSALKMGKRIAKKKSKRNNYWKIPARPKCNVRGCYGNQSINKPSHPINRCQIFGRFRQILLLSCSNECNILRFERASCI